MSELVKHFLKELLELCVCCLLHTPEETLKYTDPSSLTAHNMAAPACASEGRILPPPHDYKGAPAVHLRLDEPTAPVPR